jgi:hypothetical protein
MLDTPDCLSKREDDKRQVYHYVRDRDENQIASPQVQAGQDGT